MSIKVIFIINLFLKKMEKFKDCKNTPFVEHENFFHEFHHSHNDLHDVYKSILKEINEEAKERMREDKNLHGILHSVFHKLENLEEVKLKGLENQIENALTKIPSLSELVTDSTLRNILSRYYTKYEMDAAFATGCVKPEQIKTLAADKLNKFISYKTF